MSSSFTSQHSQIKEEIQKLQTFEQNCLNGLANCDQQFQNFAANSPNSSIYQQQFEKSETAAMVTTYTFLYVNNLKEQKMAELEEMEKKIHNEKTNERSLKVPEIGGCGFH